MIARGRLPKKRGMNKIEADFGEHLKYARAGDVVWMGYEGITLKLGDDVRYTPDWFVMTADGEFWCYEVKGPYRREDAMVKLRVAAAMYPFRFALVTRDGDEWKFKLL